MSIWYFNQKKPLNLIHFGLKNYGHHGKTAARAAKHLDHVGAVGVSLVITGGLRVAADFVKALAMGDDAVAIANSAM